MWIQWWTRRPSDTERERREESGGVRWGHCLWLTQGGSAFKSPHHLHWVPFLRSGGFGDLHSCDVKREKWGRKSRTRAADGGPSPRSSSSPTASSLPVTQARQRAEEGFVRLDPGWCHQTCDLLQNRSEHECLTSVCVITTHAKALLMQPCTQSCSTGPGCVSFERSEVSYRTRSHWGDFCTRSILKEQFTLAASLISRTKRLSPALSLAFYLKTQWHLWKNRSKFSSVSVWFSFTS